VCARRFSPETYARPTGFGSQVLDTMEGVLGLLPAPALTSRAMQGPLAHRSTPHQPPRGATADSTSGDDRIVDSGVPMSDEGTSEVDTIR
jgi:hypothetical protein